ncbi:hypothetical protein ES332_A12G124800v1 [Gossypium tomentosum]|uniref:Uncharacterized protein n=1 Tax=Gossypium tomentosum TaxID=34277 RepID=A0A5D2MVX8_GOSTO|nr:hypothetical protein ES332_A12G124800v1 [Gossypium tomentosum]
MQPPNHHQVWWSTMRKQWSNLTNEGALTTPMEVLCVWCGACGGAMARVETDSIRGCDATWS